MAKSLDQSHLDGRYFIDKYIYNCPFCNRRHVSYTVIQDLKFDWTSSKECRLFIVSCDSCSKRSLHLTFKEIYRDSNDYRHFAISPGIQGGAFLDEAMFYSVPASFFIMDERIPAVLRDLFSQAQGCLKMNYLVGASACARKVIYELAKREGAEGKKYEDRIKSLRTKLPNIDSIYFDTLLEINIATSNIVHENAYDGWEARHLRAILTVLMDILREVYVTPAIRKERQDEMKSIRRELKGKSE